MCICVIDYFHKTNVIIIYYYKVFISDHDYSGTPLNYGPAILSVMVSPFFILKMYLGVQLYKLGTTEILDRCITLQKLEYLMLGTL